MENKNGNYEVKNKDGKWKLNYMLSAGCMGGPFSSLRS